MLSLLFGITPFYYKKADAVHVKQAARLVSEKVMKHFYVLSISIESSSQAKYRSYLLFVIGATTTGSTAAAPCTR